MSAEDILDWPQPAPDDRVAYGADPNQFLDVRIPHAKGPRAVLLNVHGGYWRAKYDLAHAGRLCEALRAAGIATFNIEYRRVGNAGGGGRELSRTSARPIDSFSSNGRVSISIRIVSPSWAIPLERNWRSAWPHTRPKSRASSRWLASST